MGFINQNSEDLLCMYIALVKNISAKIDKSTALSLYLQEKGEFSLYSGPIRYINNLDPFVRLGITTLVFNLLRLKEKTITDYILKNNFFSLCSLKMTDHCHMLEKDEFREDSLTDIVEVLNYLNECYLLDDISVIESFSNSLVEEFVIPYLVPCFSNGEKRIALFLTVQLIWNIPHCSFLDLTLEMLLSSTENPFVTILAPEENDKTLLVALSLLYSLLVSKSVSSRVLKGFGITTVRKQKANLLLSSLTSNDSQKPGLKFNVALIKVLADVLDSEFSQNYSLLTMELASKILIELMGSENFDSIPETVLIRSIDKRWAKNLCDLMEFNMDILLNLYSYECSPLSGIVILS
jgi:hypothetical protein